MKALVSVLRYVPDPSRSESANVGAVVACADLGYFKFKLADGQTTRLRCFDPQYDRDRVRAYATWLSDHAEQFQEITAKGKRNGTVRGFLDEVVRLSAGDPLQAGPFYPVEFAHDVTQADLDQLLHDVIERDVRWHNHLPQTTPRGRRFETRVGELLRKEGLYKPHGRSSPVRHGYKLEGVGLVFDYGYKNGVHHVIETADVRNVHDENALLKEAAEVIVKFQRLRAAGEDAGRIALLSGHRRTGKALSQTIREVQDLSTETYYLGEDQDRRRFIEKVRHDLLPHL